MYVFVSFYMYIHTLAHTHTHTRTEAEGTGAGHAGSVSTDGMRRETVRAAQDRLDSQVRDSV